MRPRKGPTHHLEIAVLVLVALLCIPFGFLMVVFFFRYNFPTPGIYVGMLVPPLMAGGFGFFIVAGIVNVICCYAIIFALAAVMRWFDRKKETASSNGQL